MLQVGSIVQSSQYKWSWIIKEVKKQKHPDDTHSFVKTGKQSSSTPVSWILGKHKMIEDEECYVIEEWRQTTKMQF